MGRVPGLQQGIDRVDPRAYAAEQRPGLRQRPLQRRRAAHVPPGAEHLGRSHRPSTCSMASQFAADSPASYGLSVFGLGDRSGYRFSMSQPECSRVETSITWFTVRSDSLSRACEGFMPITMSGSESGVQSPMRSSAKGCPATAGSESQ